MDNRTQQAILNDQFRASGRGVVMTPGVQALPDLNELLKAIREFTKFNEDNNPYLENDFGSIDWLEGVKVFWKIDYYNETLTSWADPLTKECNRVITVMLSEEY
jgi:hypothetical protein